MTAGPSSPGALNLLMALLEARTGQHVAADRAWQIEATLTPLLRERGFATVDELAGALADGRDKRLAGQVIDAMLNQESSFFRDAATLDLAVEAVAARSSGRRPRIWSAGCSMGQEPLSLAMLFIERAEAKGGQPPEIVATDVSQAAVARARTGRFSQFEIQRGLPVRRMMRWFESAGGDWIARPDLLRHVAFRCQNLVADPAPGGRFDAVFCRNVLMYLSPDSRRRAFERLATALRPGGVLVLGAGETIAGQTAAFAPSETYRGLYVLASETGSRTQAA